MMVSSTTHLFAKPAIARIYEPWIPLPDDVVPIAKPLHSTRFKIFASISPLDETAKHGAGSRVLQVKRDGLLATVESSNCGEYTPAPPLDIRIASPVAAPP